MAENRSRTSEDAWQWGQLLIVGGVAVALLAVVVVVPASAQPAGGQGGPTYQRKGTFAGGWQGQHGGWNGKQGDWRRRPMPQFTSNTSAASFQRPYPFHLDYYRMKWGGSYAPYFGNLYGPPNYFFNGSPFFGGFAPYYGFNSSPWGGFDGGYNGFGGPGPYGNPNWGGVPYGPWAGQSMGPVGPIANEAGP